MRQYKRSTRIGEQILRDVSGLFENELSDELPGLVTFTHVRVSADLRYATVYYSVLGREEDPQNVAGYFERERRRIRHLVGRNLHLRYIPEFTFKFDPSIIEGIKIERLLNEIKTDTRE